MKLETEKKLKQFVYSQKQLRFKNGKSKMVVVYRVIFEYLDQEGKRQKLSKSGFVKPSMAKAYLDNLKVENANKTGIFSPSNDVGINPPLTFREYSETYLKELLLTIQDTSKTTKRSEIKILNEFFGEMVFADITRKHVKDFKSWIQNKPVVVEVKVRSKEQTINSKTNRKHFALTKELRQSSRAVSTINHYLKRLRNMNKTAVRDEIEGVKLIDFHGFIETSREAKRELTITFSELENLLAVCNPDLRLQTLGLFETGARLSELKGIRRKDLDFETQLGFVYNSKKRKKSEKTLRVCYFSRRLIAELKEQGKESLSDNEFLFPQGDFKKAWATALKRANVDSHLQQRDLRRTHHTNLIEAGVSENTADYQIGHGQQTLARKVYTRLRNKYLILEFQEYEKYSNEERNNLRYENSTELALSKKA